MSEWPTHQLSWNLHISEWPKRRLSWNLLLSEWPKRRLSLNLGKKHCCFVMKENLGDIVSFTTVVDELLYPIPFVVYLIQPSRSQMTKLKKVEAK